MNDITIKSAQSKKTPQFRVWVGGDLP